MTDKIISLWYEGHSAERIGYLVGCSKQHVYDVLKRHGIPRRPGSGKHKWKKSMRMFFKP